MVIWGADAHKQFGGREKRPSVRPLKRILVEFLAGKAFQTHVPVQKLDIAILGHLWKLGQGPV